MEPDDDKTQSHVALSKGTMVSHYRIIEKIGSGGMGEVYLALDTKLNRKVALKFLPRHLCQDEDCRKRFTREAQAAAGLDHPNIIRVLDHGTDGSTELAEVGELSYLAMELIDGPSLKTALQQRKEPLPPMKQCAWWLCLRTRWSTPIARG